MRVRISETARPCDATEKFRLQGSHDPRPPSKRSQDVPKPGLDSRAVACADCRTRSGKRQASALVRFECDARFAVEKEDDADD